MTYTNSQILSAVLNKYLQPVVVQFAQMKMGSLPFVQAIENKVRSMGFVSGNWSLINEVAPLIEPITGNLVQPMINKYLSQIPDAAIPEMAHSIVDKAIANGGLSLMEGRLQFEKEDLIELKKLLDWNLPLVKEEEYQVVMSEPKEEITKE